MRVEVVVVMHVGGGVSGDGHGVGGIKRKDVGEIGIKIVVVMTVVKVLVVIVVAVVGEKVYDL